MWCCGWCGEMVWCGWCVVVGVVCCGWCGVLWLVW